MILFVAHEAKRTGAPIALLNLLRWLRRSDALDFQVLRRPTVRTAQRRPVADSPGQAGHMVLVYFYP